MKKKKAEKTWVTPDFASDMGEPWPLMAGRTGIREGIDVESGEVLRGVHYTQ